MFSASACMSTTTYMYCSFYILPKKARVLVSLLISFQSIYGKMHDVLRKGAHVGFSCCTIEHRYKIYFSDVSTRTRMYLNKNSMPCLMLTLFVTFFFQFCPCRTKQFSTPCYFPIRQCTYDKCQTSAM